MLFKAEIALVSQRERDRETDRDRHTQRQTGSDGGGGEGGGTKRETTERLSINITGRK